MRPAVRPYATHFVLVSMTMRASQQKLMQERYRPELSRHRALTLYYLSSRTGAAGSGAEGGFDKDQHQATPEEDVGQAEGVVGNR